MYIKLLFMCETLLLTFGNWNTYNEEKTKIKKIYINDLNGEAFCAMAGLFFRLVLRSTKRFVLTFYHNVHSF